MRISDWSSDVCSSDLADPAVHIGTIAAEITLESERREPSVVKAAVGFPAQPKVGRLRIARALYFSRATVPSGEGPHYHHIGIYAYRRTALARFVGLPPGVLERRERLAQLRALEAGMRIDVALVDTVSSEERRVGKEGVRTCRSRGVP